MNGFGSQTDLRSYTDSTAPLFSVQPDIHKFLIYKTDMKTLPTLQSLCEG